MSAILPPRPSVSIITPTYGREEFIPAIADCVRSQTYRDIEWLVFDDSEKLSAELSNNSWDKLKYIHLTERLSIGEKRNRLLDIARGDIIVHFDDDDFYGPDYVSSVVEYLESKQSEVALLSGFFVVHLNAGRVGFCRTRLKNGPAFIFSPKGIGMIRLEDIKIPFIHLCYGWAFAYRKKVWKECPFKQINAFEDREFMRTVQQKFQIHAHEFEGVQCFHSVHAGSSSICYPQFNIPVFILRSLSSAAFQHLSRLRSIAEKNNLALPQS